MSEERKESSMDLPRHPGDVKALPYASRNSKIFKAITEFADQLNDVFGKEDVNVNKVYKILTKTSLTNRKVVERHLVIFHQI